jgi:hypothetical protein
MLRSSSCSLQHDLGPAVLTLVEVLIALRRLFERQFVRDDLRRLDLAGRNQIAKLAVIRLHACGRLASIAIDYKTQNFEDAVCDVDLVYDMVGGQTQERSSNEFLSASHARERWRPAAGPGSQYLPDGSQRLLGSRAGHKTARCAKRRRRHPERPAYR